MDDRQEHRVRLARATFVGVCQALVEMRRDGYCSDARVADRLAVAFADLERAEAEIKAEATPVRVAA